MDADTGIGDDPLFRIRLWGPFRVEKRVGGAYEVVRTAEWSGSSYPHVLLKALLCCPSHMADWGDLPAWQQETDSDIFEAIERQG
jgi:hypothetical protein